MIYPVVIKCSKERKKTVGAFLKRYGLLWAGDSYIGNIYYIWDFERIEEYCREQKLRLWIDKKFAIRGNGYRSHFFKTYPPHVGSRYFCAYCGKLLPQKYLTVDHLYPIGSARKSVRLQRKLRRMGIRNINDTRNLVPSCRRCNQQKGKKMGMWVVRGRIGRHPEIWMIRIGMRVAVVSAVVTGVLYFVLL